MHMLWVKSNGMSTDLAKVVAPMKNKDSKTMLDTRPITILSWFTEFDQNYGQEITQKNLMCGAGFDCWGNPWETGKHLVQTPILDWRVHTT